MNKKNINNEILQRGLWSLGTRVATWASSRATWLALAGSICPRSARCGCFERALSPDLVVLPLEPARPGLSRTPRASIFEHETLVFSKFLRVTNTRCAKRPTSKKHCKNHYETHFGAVVHRAQIDQNSSCVGHEKHSPTRTHLTSLLGRSRRASGASWERTWNVFGLSWNTPGRPESALGAF